MKNCPKCQSENRIKRGFIKTRQRYLCKNCNFSYTVEIKSTAKPLTLKKQALQLYLEGLGFRAIGRILKVSNVSVLKWIRSFGEKIAELKNEQKSQKILEIDEIHTYVQSKKTTFGSGLLLIDLEKNSSVLFVDLGDLKQEKG